MASYIGKVQIGTGDPVLIGSTLYGICRTAENVATKTVTSTDDNSGKFINNNYDNPIQGTTIHVKFINGNTVDSGVTLQVGTLTTGQLVIGRCTCPANTIISFTLDENQHWVTNDNVDTNTEYVFKSEYNSTNKRVITENDIRAAAEKGVITDIGANTTSTDLPTAAAVVSYVTAQTGGLSGLTGAMHFRGVATVEITDGGTENPTIENYTFNGNGDNAGDVVLWNNKEFVWTGTRWELLGDEGSYALKSSTDTITEVSNFTANTLPTLTVTPTDTSKVTVTDGSAASLTTNNVTVPNVTAAGSATTASVSGGILNITIGVPPTIAETPITIKAVDEFTANTPTSVTAQTVSVGSASGWNAGTQASLNTNDTIVVVPNATNP